MTVHAINHNLTITAKAMQSNLDKDTIIVLSIDKESGAMSMGWAGDSTVKLLGVLTWGISAITEDLDNETLI